MIGYEWPEQSAEWFMERSNAGTRKGPWPEVKWLKVAVLTATVKSSAPQEVEKSYREWEKWADFIQEVRLNKRVVCLRTQLYCVLLCAPHLSAIILQ